MSCTSVMDASDYNHNNYNHLLIEQEAGKLMQHKRLLERNSLKKRSGSRIVAAPSLKGGKTQVARMVTRSQSSVVIIKIIVASLLVSHLLSLAVQVVYCLKNVAQNETLIRRVDENDDDLTLNTTVDRSGRSNDEFERQELMLAEPRQQFKLHLVGPSKRSSFKFLDKAAHSIHHRQVSSPVNNWEKINSTSTQLQSEHQQPRRSQPSKSKISNARLKKLLEQSLLKASNGTLLPSAFNSTATNGSRGSNFKFVFIQRATAAPSTNSIKSPLVEQQQQQHQQVKKNSLIGNQSTKSNSPQAQASMAASISKQLASSLFYSAANIVGNITSSAPSISSLVAQTLDSSLSLASTTSTTTTTRPASVTTFGQSNSDNLIDIKRISASNGDTKGKQKNGAKRQGAGKPRPSKIYNLPVKFVANGQPNVVFSTLKNHFASMKRLQSMGIKDSALNGSVTKRKRPHNGHISGNSKTKGNSRLIYLPLKYLSNARPNKIQLINSKATHKSNN